MSAPLLEVRDLTVVHDGDGGTRTLIDAVSLDLAAGEILGLVGESGSGKSLLCRSLVRLLPSTPAQDHRRRGHCSTGAT